MTQQKSNFPESYNKQPQNQNPQTGNTGFADRQSHTKLPNGYSPVITRQPHQKVNNTLLKQEKTPKAKSNSIVPLALCLGITVVIAPLVFSLTPGLAYNLKATFNIKDNDCKIGGKFQLAPKGAPPLGILVLRDQSLNLCLNGVVNGKEAGVVTKFENGKPLLPNGQYIVYNNDRQGKKDLNLRLEPENNKPAFTYVFAAIKSDGMLVEDIKSLTKEEAKKFKSVGAIFPAPPSLKELDPTVSLGIAVDSNGAISQLHKFKTKDGQSVLEGIRLIVDNQVQNK
jgi:hypothetical protein